jgi:hypothetical protein
MIHGLEAVRDVVGPADESGIPDSAIKDALWEYYFDVAQTIDWVYGMLHPQTRFDSSKLLFRGTSSLGYGEGTQRSVH